jgi:hypothetical protein
MADTAGRINEQKLLALSEISLQLDTYNDIFSSFDPRPYTSRLLSIDFLEEAKRASRDLPFGNIEIKFLIHEGMRSIGKEALIRKRLREHFIKHNQEKRLEYRRFLQKGWMFVFAGLVLMLGAAYMLFKNWHTLGAGFLLILLEPAGWFFFWEGLDIVLLDSKSKKPDMEFYRKMADCKITFTSY